MSDEPNSKRRKMNRKNTYQSQNKAKKFLEPGICGFLATCNFAEKECVRECYNLLNDFADQLTLESERQAVAIESEKSQSKNDASNVDGTVAEKLEHGGGSGNGNDDKQSGEVVEKPKDDDDEEEEDISTLLQKEINTINANKRENRNRFQQVETNVSNVIFIKTTLPNPNELGVRIVREIAELKKRKTRMLLRFWPVDAVCRANINDIKNAAGQLFDKVFLNAEPTTYSIAFNKRHNNVIDRMNVIEELAALVDFKNSAHKVDLKTPKITIVIEVIKGLCCISLLPDYFKLKKYNVHELVQVDKESKETTNAEPQGKPPKDESELDSAEMVGAAAAAAADDDADSDANKSNADATEKVDDQQS